MPPLTIEPVLTIGTAAIPFDAAGLQQRLQNALSRFDEVRVHVDPAAAGSANRVAPRSGRLSPGDDPRCNRMPRRRSSPSGFSTAPTIRSCGRRPIPTSAPTAPPSKAFCSTSCRRWPARKAAVLPNERRKRAASASIDPHYSCILDSYETWRRYTADLHGRVRTCLQQLTLAVPNSSVGHAMLAYVYVREHYFGRAERDGDVPWADRAFAAARRAVELNPNSALAFHALSGALFARSNIPQGLAAAEKAVELNPYNVIMISGLGFRLVRVGEIERGLALLRQAAPYRSGFSSWYAFTMCIGSYLTGDLATAAKYDLAAITDTFPPGFVASALIAAKTGDQAAGAAGDRPAGRAAAAVARQSAARAGEDLPRALDGREAPARSVRPGPRRGDRRRGRECTRARRPGDHAVGRSEPTSTRGPAETGVGVHSASMPSARSLATERSQLELGKSSLRSGRLRFSAIAGLPNASSGTDRYRPHGAVPPASCGRSIRGTAVNARSPML